MDEAALPPTSSGLRILQWNVLGDSDKYGYIDERMRKYVSPPACLDWASRCQAIARRVGASNADAIFLEECTEAMLSDLLKLLERSGEYGSWHAGALDGGKDCDEIDVALLVQTTAVEVLGAPRCARLHWLCAEGQERDTMALPGAGTEPPTSYVALSAALRRRAGSGSVFVVAGTHLRWEFGDGFGGAAAGKPLQALAAARHLRQHAVDAGAAGWALAGDFNSSPDDGPPLLLTTGRLPASHPQLMSKIDHDLALPFEAPLVSAFRLVHGREPLYTRKKDALASQFCLDYVFVGGALRPTAAGFGAGPPPYTSPDGSDLAFLPNEEWPSDHLPVVVDLEEVAS